MAHSDERLHVVVFDDQRDPLYRELAAEGAEEAGWQPHIYDDPQEAMRLFELKNPNALITALGKQKSIFGAYPGRGLIQLSTELDIPRAIYSAHPLASHYVRPLPSLDTLIEKDHGLEIPTLVSRWLGKVASARISHL